MFHDLIDILTENGKGIHAYRAFASRALALAADAERPERAAAYMLLANAADTFVQDNDRMPLSSADMARVFDEFQSHCTMLDAAEGAADHLAALNRIARSMARMQAAA